MSVVEKKAAIVVGVGPLNGLGGALCQRFGQEGLHVFPAGRTAQQLEEVASAIRDAGGTATPVVTDTTREADVIRLFETVDQHDMPLTLTVYNAGNMQMSPMLDMSAELFEAIWRVGCFGGFVVGREAARRMVANKQGSMLFTGATASMRGRPPFTGFASAKAGLRVLAQGMAREFGPQGVHVAHVIVDGVIDGEKIQCAMPQYLARKGEHGALSLEALAETFWQLHTQHPSAWTHELDVRPYNEEF